MKGTLKDYPNLEEITPTLESKVEEKKSFSVNLVISAESLFGIGNIININKYSSLTKLLRVTALVQRFVNNLRLKRLRKEVITGVVKVSEIKYAEIEWVKLAQVALKEQAEYKQLERQYGLIEKNGILRCTGRLGRSDLEADAREPIVLPKKHRLTELVINLCHKAVMHSGVRSTLAQLRSKYWIPKGRQEVKRVIGRCLVCKRWNSKPFTPTHQADLPDFRVKKAAPFENSGVDFAGPLYVKTKSGMTKVYIALFTCCVTRAIHLELVHDLSAATFLRCLRRFIARLGTPRIIVSDNAKTFKAAKKALRELFESEEVNNCLSDKGIDWKFNLERAPWWGGFFERMVGLVKGCLRKVLGNAKLTFDELGTVLAEVEANLNSRPLTYEYEEVGSEVLTPSHLVYGRRIVTLPDSKDQEVSRLDEEPTKTNSIARFKHLSTVLGHFWSRWKREYLTNLREFHKVGVVDKEYVLVEPGDVVIVYEQGKKRGEWRTGLVQELICGKDNVVRGARVCVMTNGHRQVLNRALQHLYPVEVKDGNAVKEVVKEVVGETSVEKPKREAALNARWKVKAMLDP